MRARDAFRDELAREGARALVGLATFAVGVGLLEWSRLRAYREPATPRPMSEWLRAAEEAIARAREGQAMPDPRKEGR